MQDLPQLAFWLIAALMAALALAFVLPRLVGGRAPPAGRSRQALNADVCRGQLADLARERAEGALSADDYERARADVERRLIDEAAPPGGAVGVRPARRTAWTLAALFPLAAVAMYFAFGTPAALDGTRVAARDDPAAFRTSLARHLADNPSDARSWVMLARAEFEADRFTEAAHAYERAVASSQKVARDPQVLCELADALGMANGGTLKGRPRELVTKALAIDPRHPRALEMAGSAMVEDGDFAGAAASWRALLVQLAPGSAEHRELSAAIARAESLVRTPVAGAAAARP